MWASKRLAMAVCLVAIVAAQASAQTWTAPRTWTTGELVTSSIMNTHIRDNELVLRAGGMAITSQAAGDVLCASSSTQLGRIAAVAVGQVVISNGTGACPTYSATLPTAVQSNITQLGTVSSAGNVALLNAANAFTAVNTITKNNGTTYGSSLQLQLGSGSSGQRAELKLTDGVTSNAFISLLPSATASARYVSIGSSGTETVQVFGDNSVSMSGVLNLTLNNVTHNIGGTGTGAVLTKFFNTSGTLYAGVDSSTGASFALGNYSAVLATDSANGMSISSSAGGDIRFYQSGVKVAAVSAGSMSFYDLTGTNADVFVGGGAATGVIQLNSRALGTGAVTGPTFRIGINNSGSHSAGNINFLSIGAVNNYVWVDNSASPGVMRISTSRPEEDGTPSDTSGTVVGSQTSTLDTKLLIAPFVDTAHALDVVSRAPLWRFRYKGGSYNGTEFVGVMSNTTPEVMMDPSPTHPEGQSFSPVSAFGYAAAAIAELRKQLERMKNPYAGIFGDWSIR